MARPRAVLRALPGTYGTSIELSAGELTIVGTGAIFQGAPSGTPRKLVVTGGAKVAVRGLELDLSRGQVVCDGRGSGTPTLRLSELTVGPGASAFIFAAQCKLEISRVEIVSNGESALTMFDDAELDASQLRIRAHAPAQISAVGRRMRVKVVNSIFDNTSIYFSPTDDATTTSRLELAYNTIAAVEPLLQGCGPASTQNKVTLVENNILLGLATQDVIDGPHCTTANNVLFPQSAAIPGQNLVADPKLVDPLNRDFRLQPDSPALDAAVPSVGLDPDHDFVGTPRPQGARPDIGALERVP